MAETDNPENIKEAYMWTEMIYKLITMYILYPCDNLEGNDIILYFSQSYMFRVYS